MRHLIEKWVARAKAKRAQAATIEVIEESNEQSPQFYAEFEPITGADETTQMGEITGSFRLIEKQIDKATRGTKEATASAQKISNNIGMPPTAKAFSK